MMDFKNNIFVLSYFFTLQSAMKWNDIPIRDQPFRNIIIEFLIFTQWMIASFLFQGMVTPQAH